MQARRTIQNLEVVETPSGRRRAPDQGQLPGREGRPRHHPPGQEETGRLNPLRSPRHPGHFHGQLPSHLDSAKTRQHHRARTAEKGIAGRARDRGRHQANRRPALPAPRRAAKSAEAGKKPWRQKGTGRARAGSADSPLWCGGGVIFGPKPRDYSKKVQPTRQEARLPRRAQLRASSTATSCHVERIRRGRRQNQNLRQDCSAT